ncbi:heterodisulfide reductase subunit B [Desulfacinum hydrothermale DSM 13146]|uniref:Heterodisulfide reductase subunit B n=1 Tax=Desulfacinum hydrothermale DSM 13146 TaxID=1121390 RepID=A0A1W1XI58_9BACT|nr:CoB--CoM heterodisulfide reductase iron-sulfur subunit B family protein [Desulfacinum hydrothermale]SMC23517.1 heterodisulfide reductase subunit B [Desulfacinum hydrothermale DSM 13146]
METVGYYPGCSLEGTARDYAASIQGVCEMLHVELRELDDWNCCGATAAHSLNRRLAVELPGRNLVLAEKQGLSELVVPCALCFNRLKTAEKALLGPQAHRFSLSYEGSVHVVDLLDFLARPKRIRWMKTHRVRSLEGLRAVCYYGCMVNRPPKVTNAPSWENPTNMDDLLSALGVQVLDWPFKTDCCGASHSVGRPDLVTTLTGRLFSRALAQGANCIVVSCQMCQANLDMFQERVARERKEAFHLPVFYFTDLMALALGDPRAAGWARRHLVDPMPLLEALGLAV